jgi:hypothetical protein
MIVSVLQDDITSVRGASLRAPLLLRNLEIPGALFVEYGDNMTGAAKE